MQNLYYNSGSGKVTLTTENNTNYIWNGITAVNFPTNSIQGNIISGSTILGYFPLNNTNIFYPPFPNINSISGSFTSSLINISWRFDLSSNFTAGELSGSLCFITASSLYYVSQSITSNNGSIKLPADSTYLFYTKGSGSYDSSLILRDTTSGSIIYTGTGSSLPISTSYSLLNFHNYEVTFSITYLAP